MHVQIVTFGLDGMPEGEYIDVATRLAPRFAALPGLLAKVWLESPDGGIYGGIYFWEDQEAMDRFVASDLFEGTHPAFTNLDSSDFAVLGNLTRATQPGITVLDQPAPRGRAPQPPLPAPPAKPSGPAKAVKAAKTVRKTATATAPAPGRASRVNKIEAVSRPARPRRAAATPEPAPPPPKPGPRTRRPAG